MKEYPKGGVVGTCIHAVKDMQELHIPLYAANAGFFIILSLFPALVLILSLLRYTGLQVQSLIDLLATLVPAALMDTVGDLVLSTYENSSGALVGVSALGAIWSASKGVYSLLTGLNAVYGVSENRGFLYTRFISVLYTIALFVVLILTLAVQVFGTALMQLAPIQGSPLLGILNGILSLRFFLLVAVQSGFFALMYAFLPNRHNRIRDTWPGALLASLGWLIFSNLYSVYVEKFASLTNIYGSVYAVALSMLWLYFCMSILFYGGALNQFLEEHK